jgi:hypothetical protein
MGHYWSEMNDLGTPKASEDYKLSLESLQVIREALDAQLDMLRVCRMYPFYSSTRKKNKLEKKIAEIEQVRKIFSR